MRLASASGVTPAAGRIPIALGGTVVASGLAARVAAT